MKKRPHLKVFPKVQAREVDGGVFAIDEFRGEIHALDEISASIWKNLRDYDTEEKILDLFTQAFPDKTREDLATTVRKHIRTLEKNGLVYRAGPAAKQNGNK